jgi:hypothetical protein
LIVLLLHALAAFACAGPAANSDKATGDRVDIGPASVVPPKGWRKLETLGWMLPLDEYRALVLRVNRIQEPDQGADAHVDQLLADVRKSGTADVEADRNVMLGDLDGRLIQTVETQGSDPQALWLIVALAEDGLYTASAVGPAAEMHKRRTEIEAFLLSLRVAPLRRSGGLVAKPLPAELELAADATPVR